MSSNFIPMLSSTPPPLEECGSFEDDDDFGDFTAAAWTLGDESPVKKTSAQAFEEKAPHQSNGHIQPMEESPKHLYSKKVAKESVLNRDSENGQDASEVEGKSHTSQESERDSSLHNSASFTVPNTEDSGLNLKDTEDSTCTRVNGVEVDCGEDEEEKLDEAEAADKEVEDLDLGTYCRVTSEVEKEHLDQRTALELCGQVDDEFADFASAQFAASATSPESTHFPPGEQQAEEFADFEQASCAEFKEGSIEKWAHFESTAQKDDLLDKEGLSSAQNKILKMLSAAFPQVKIDNAEEFVESTSARVSLLGNTDDASHRLWSKLEDLDRSVSLQYQWNGSRAFQRLLYSLSIDSRNILRNPSVPIFALGLGLLEPMKVADDADAEAPWPSATEVVIPPAQFDWSSSGLVNPLDPLQSSSSLLDLDFFVRSSRASSSTVPTSSLEEEFLGPNVPSPGANPALLQQLLKDSKSTMLESGSGRPAELSEAAVRILDQLPDLSFMRAKVLMFPVRCTLES